MINIRTIQQGDLVRVIDHEHTGFDPKLRGAVGMVDCVHRTMERVRVDFGAGRPEGTPLLDTGSIDDLELVEA